MLWLRMPLPFKLDHINLWLIAEEDGWAMVDTGYADDRTRALWERIFTGPMLNRKPTRLLVTHFHPDHLGLAGWLEQRFAITTAMSLGEWLYGRMLMLDGSEAFLDNQVEFYRKAGFDADLLALVRRRGNSYAARISPIPVAVHRLQAGQELNIGGHIWQVIIGTA
ncbi:MAG: MBL fold metallo-hydrolase, partial [Rhodospirillales bacterium]|nr:MBL fold metallo-hydrolase [Rhodospirillales bacterium]